MRPINVLSFFDGMSCGQIALERAGVPVGMYAACEIDKYAVQVARSRYPKMIQLGDVSNWRMWIDDIPCPDLFIAGSPCQGFSHAGKRLNFDDPRSKLFFVFCEVLEYLRSKNPDIKFMLENVKMKKEWRDIITERLGVEPVLINSALVSAQNRERYYWANFPITQPDDKGILLKDIIEHGEVDRDKSYAIDAHYFKGGSSKNMAERYFSRGKRQIVADQQSTRRLMVTVKRVPHGFNKGSVEVDAQKHPSLHAQSPHANHMMHVTGQIEVIRTDGKSGALTTAHKDNLLIRVGTADIKGHDYNRRVYSAEGKAPSLAARSGGNLQPKVATDDIHWRKLTVLECERLQTVPEGYTEGVSNTQRYKMLGNGWTVDVIAHIFRCAYADN